ncbi:MAG: aminotransferase class V-fold PLP-dependent enzyme [Blastocatellia bacterium]|nr:aminotransferase class V-fold PLP-dependent enzyme [Blastocatellia bacterium]
MNIKRRELFPVTKDYIYLNHAAVAPLPLPAFEAMQRYTRDLLEHGLVHWREWGQEVERVRALAAQLINAKPHEIAFAANTSTGLSLVANGLNWRAGDNVVTADCEFPANQLPWQRLQKAYGVEVRQAKEREGRLETEELLSLIDERTRVVTLSFVEFASGFRNDLATIGKFCREREVLFVVDAIQGLGALQLDVASCCIDALSADAHKFLLGPDGVAIFYVSERWLERLQPTVVGWTSVKEPFDFARPEKEFADGARRFEPGALNTAGIMGLGASMSLLLQTGLPTIERYLLDLTEYLCDGLNGIGYHVVSSRRAGEASAVVCCTHETHSAERLYEHLDAQQIITTPRLGRLRISPHFYNTREDIDQVIKALAEFIGTVH